MRSSVLPAKLCKVMLIPNHEDLRLGQHVAQEGLCRCLGRELAGGVVAKPGNTTEQFGIAPLLVIRLLELGVRPDPQAQPEIDRSTSRPNWGRYPVIFADAA